MSRKARITDVNRLESEVLQGAGGGAETPPQGATRLTPSAGNVNLLAAGTQLGAFNVTPEFSGDFNIQAMLGVTNTEAVAHTGQMVVTASNVPAGGVKTFTYNSTAVDLRAAIGAGQQIAATMQTKGDVGPFPLGIPVTFTLIGKGDVDNKVQAVNLTGMLQATELV